MKNRIVMLVTAVGLGLGMGWVLAAQQAAPEKKWQGENGGREEYELYEAVTKAKDAKSQKAALDAWAGKFPNSDYAADRDDMFLITHQQLNDARGAFEQAKKIRQRKPHDLLSLNAMVTLIYQLNPASDADLAAAEEAGRYILGNLNKIFEAPNKPGTMTEPQFTAARGPLEQLGQRIVAFVPYQQKDYPKAEVEIRKFLAMDGTQALFSQMLGNSLMQQQKNDPNKVVPALFHLARAAAYTGKNELAPAARQQVDQYLTSSYTQYHGSNQGLTEVKNLAKANVMPPANFTIKSIVDIKREEIEADNAWKAAHPDLALWRDAIRGPLQAPDGAGFWENLKDAALPGDPASNGGVSMFSGTIISSTQEKGNTKQLVVAVFDPKVADATLDLVEPLPGTMDPGGVIKFKGEAKAYTAQPFNLTLEVVEPEKDVEGWTGVAASSAKGGKGGAKGGPKGKQIK